ncbi:MAG: DUF1697 domain-containing protein [Vicinamibacterales bacterium]
MADDRRVALWRAVNVGGRNRLPMRELRESLTELGFTAPQTIGQSGNAVFGSPLAPSELEAMIEATVRRRFGLEADVCVRTAAEWTGLIRGMPFEIEARSHPGHVLALCLKSRVGSAGARALAAAIAEGGGRERARVVGRHAYLVYPDGIGTSRLTSSVIERALGTRSTARNWNTVLKVDAQLAGA